MPVARALLCRIYRVSGKRNHQKSELFEGAVPAGRTLLRRVCVTPKYYTGIKTTIGLPVSAKVGAYQAKLCAGPLRPDLKSFKAGRGSVMQRDELNTRNQLWLEEGVKG